MIWTRSPGGARPEGCTGQAARCPWLTIPDHSPSADTPLFPMALARKQKKSQPASMHMKFRNRQNQTHGAGIGTGWLLEKEGSPLEGV